MDAGMAVRVSLVLDDDGDAGDEMS